MDRLCYIVEIDPALAETRCIIIKVLFYLYILSSGYHLWKAVPASHKIAADLTNDSFA